MASAKEYFEKDSSQNLRIGNVQTLGNTAMSGTIDVTLAMSFDFEASAKFSLLYVPDTPSASEVVAYYLSNIPLLLAAEEAMEVQFGKTHTDESISSRDLVFTRRLSVYTQYRFSSGEKAALQDFAHRVDIRLVLRDAAYAEGRAQNEIPMAFISHDNRDKEPFVRELAATLQKMYCTVWYDEYSLVAGSSLRESIEKGLKECQKCVLVLSPNFVENKGWSKAEFDSIFTREILEKKNVIIPIWHGVSKEQVYQYSPRLLDKVALASSLGVEEVARRLLRAINASD